MNKKRNREIGTKGENLAAEYLKSQGYKIIDRNIVCDFGEIDILAQTPKGEIVLVEVKTVRGDSWGQSIDLVRYKKQQKLRSLALAVAKEYPNSDIRIDIIGIDNGKINHIENAVWG